MEKQISSICLVCGQLLELRSDRDVKYCSRQCASKAKLRLMDQICPECNQVFHPNNHGQVYCSKRCLGDAKINKHKTATCQQCGESFKPTRGKANTYCSHRCYNLGRAAQVTVVCPYCNREFVARQSQKRKYCSRKCKHDDMILPLDNLCHDLTRKEWLDLSKKLRSEYPCQLCGATKYLGVHHIIPRSVCRILGIYPHFQENLIVVCRHCHPEVEVRGIRRLIGVSAVEVFQWLGQKLARVWLK